LVTTRGVQVKQGLLINKWQVCPITDRRRTCRGPVQRPLI